MVISSNLGFRYRYIAVCRANVAGMPVPGEHGASTDIATSGNSSSPEDASRDMPTPHENPGLSERSALTPAPKIKVLFVDDNDGVRNSTTMLLQILGFDVSSASDQSDVAKILEAGVRPDVIVSDFHLAQCTGVDVITAVREALAEESPAIIITGDTSALSSSAAWPFRTEILQKPFKQGVLAELIRSMAG